MEGGGSGQVSGLSRHLPGGTEENIKYVSQDRRSPDRGMIPGLP
jgi:hypothetical protein